MDKETISQMTLQELADFPLDDFFDHYERGLRRVSVFVVSVAAILMKVDGECCLLHC